jgi:pyrroloquinoline quinone biosynthesis protein B
VRAGTVRARRRTEEAAAVSADGDGWVLLNAPGDVGRQIDAFDRLHPRGARHTPIRAIVLTNGDLDHTLGLLRLRESQPLTVLATDRVRRSFTDGNVLYRTLERFPGQVTWRTLVAGREEPLLDEGPRLTIEAVVAPGKAPVHLGACSPHPEDNVGLLLRDRAAGRCLAYFPSVARLTAAVIGALAGADVVVFDGTFWASDELPALGLGVRRAEQMGHLPVGGPGGSLATLAERTTGRRIYTHMNNTNPMLREGSAEYAAVREAGWAIAHDGLEIVL